MTDQTPEQAALTIAARIANALGEQWARCPEYWGDSSDVDSGCQLALGHTTSHTHRLADGTVIHWATHSTDAKLPQTLAAAQAEWAAAGGDPERGPALSGRSADGRVEWSIVYSDITQAVMIRIGVGAVRVTRGIDEKLWWPGDGTPHGWLADWTECVRLMAAADGGAK